MQKNEIIELAIEDIGTDGQGIGKYEGIATFVSGALPGEQIRAKIIALKKKYAVGKLEEILSPSPHRVKPPCNVFGKCGGCTLQHLAYPAQLEYKQSRVRECMQRIGKLEIPILFPLPSPREYHYRNKGSFPVQVKDEQPVIGLYAAHSHTIVDVDDCKIQRGEVTILLSQLRVWLVKYGVSLYDEQSHIGLLRHVVVRVNKTKEMMLILVVNGEDIPFRSELLSLFKFVLPQLKHIVLNINTQETNVIMGKENRVIHGRGYMEEIICGLEFRVSPTSFLQVNNEQMEVLYKNLFSRLEIDPHEIVLDLYCGIGTITLCAAKHAKKVYGIEISDEAVNNARFNAKYNETENVEFFAGDAARLTHDIIEKEGYVHTIIIDPPRKGLPEPLIETIAAAAPQKIGYVSCDPATMARDLALFDNYGYCAESIQPVDLFPQTTHVECLTVLYKVNG